MPDIGQSEFLVEMPAEHYKTPVLDVGDMFRRTNDPLEESLIQDCPSDPVSDDEPPSLVVSRSSTSSISSASRSSTMNNRLPTSKPSAEQSSPRSTYQLLNVVGRAKNEVAQAKVSCDHPGCKTECGRPSDLKRHKKTIHEDQRFLCGCCKNQGTEKRRCRHDKINEHLRDDHRLSNQKKEFKCRKAMCNELRFASDDCVRLHYEIEHVDDNSALSSSLTSSDSGDQDISCPCLKQLTCNAAKRSTSEEPGPLSKRRRRDSVSMTAQPSEFSFSSIDQDHETPTPVNSNSGLISWQQDVANDMIYINESSYRPCDLQPENSLVASESTLAQCAANGQIPFNAVHPMQAAYNQKILIESMKMMPSSFMETSLQVRPADFAALYWFGRLDIVQNTLKHDIVDVSMQGFQSISYNVGATKLTLRGSRMCMFQVAKILHANIQWLSNNQGENFLSGSCTDTTKDYVANAQRRGRTNAALRTAKVTMKNQNKDEMRMFTFDSQDYPDEFDTWNNILLTGLPKVLRDAVGWEYTASLIEFGIKKLSAVPCIQIETPLPLGTETKNDIVEKTWLLYKARNRHDRIQIVFVNGVYVKLAGHTQPNFSNLDDEDRGRYQFCYNRLWPSPGMGAAVTMRISDSVSGTLGGYLEIDQKPYIVVSAHLVEDARNTPRMDARWDERKELVSPPQEVLEELDEWIRKELREGRAIIEKDLASLAADNQRQTGNGEIVPEDLKGHLSAKQGLALLFQNDLRWMHRTNSPHEPTTIGFFSRMREEPRLSPTLERTLNIKGQVFQDWALIEAKEAAVNRHRFRSADDAWTALELDRNPPEGETCNTTCDPSRESAEVHYVGRTSGHRKCTVNSAPIIIGRKGHEIKSYFALDPGKTIVVEEVLGDSGAWIIREDNNKVLGQLIGYNQGKLIFTPINDVIHHIQEVCQTPNVRLPGGIHIEPTRPVPEMCTLSYKRPLISLDPIRTMQRASSIMASDDDTSSETTSHSPPPSPSSSELWRTSATPALCHKSSLEDLDDPPTPSPTNELDPRMESNLSDGLTVTYIDESKKNQDYSIPDGGRSEMDVLSTPAQATKPGHVASSKKPNPCDLNFIMQKASPSQPCNTRMPSDTQTPAPLA